VQLIAWLTVLLSPISRLAQVHVHALDVVLTLDVIDMLAASLPPPPPPPPLVIPEIVLPRNSWHARPCLKASDSTIVDLSDGYSFVDPRSTLGMLSRVNGP